ncbi:MAG: biopolymer transporter ExbD [Methylophaga sp.]|nr:MAG: biopolymer transporter ExbD [Methylophaga sp.]
MQFPQRQRPQNNEDSILPLINIVFLLLIFFMVAGHLSVADPFRIDPPVSDSDGKTQIGDTVILLAADGRLVFDGGSIEKNELEQIVVEQMKSKSEIQVQLKADAQVEAIDVVEIMEILRTAGVKKLQLLTLVKKE